MCMVQSSRIGPINISIGFGWVGLKFSKPQQNPLRSGLINSNPFTLQFNINWRRSAETRVKLVGLTIPLSTPTCHILHHQGGDIVN